MRHQQQSRPCNQGSQVPSTPDGQWFSLTNCGRAAQRRQQRHTHLVDGPDVHIPRVLILQRQGTQQQSTACIVIWLQLVHTHVKPVQCWLNKAACHAVALAGSSALQVCVQKLEPGLYPQPTS